MSYKIIIIGSGFGSLSAAGLLAKDGHQVTVFEKNSQPGGRAQQHQAQGFTFDMGPSWYMMPEVYDRFFEEMGQQTSDFYQLEQLDPSYRVIWSDGQVVDIPTEPEQVAKIFDQIESGSWDKFFQYLKDSQFKYEMAMQHILYKNADSIVDYLSKPVIKHGGKLQPFKSAHNFIQEYFSHPKIQQILEYNLVFLGCSPDNAPSLFTMMAHVDFNLGVWYPPGGFGALVKAMYRLDQEAGVNFRFNSPVETIVTQDKQVVGVKVKGKLIKADIVISNADLHHTESILDNQELRQYRQNYWDKKTLVPSAHLMYLGVKGKLPELIHHNLYFAEDWRQHFHQVFDQPRWPVSPSIYINNPSYSDPSLAPKGHSALMILTPVAVNLEDNPSWRQAYGDYILSYLESKMGLNLKDKLIYRKDFSVADFEQTYNSYQGNALGGLAHTLFQSALWRPNNRHQNLKNMFLVGANTVPGIGVPTAVISGHLVRDRVRDHQV